MKKPNMKKMPEKFKLLKKKIEGKIFSMSSELYIRFKILNETI